MAESRPANTGLRIAGLIHAPHDANDVIRSQRTPVSAVERVVPVVAEDEILTRRERNRPPGVARGSIGRRVPRDVPYEEGPLPGEVLGTWIDARLRMPGIPLDQITPVHAQRPLVHFERVAGNSHDALDEGLRRVQWPAMHDDITASHREQVTLLAPERPHCERFAD